MLLSWRGLWRRPARTSLTILGAALSFATYLVLMMSARGLVASLEATMATSRSEVVVQQAGVGLPLLSRVSSSDLGRLAGIPGVRDVHGLIVQMTRLPDNSQLFVLGIDTAHPFAALLRITEGRKARSGSSEILFGHGASIRSGLHAGQQVELLRQQLFTVTGVYETGYGLFDNAAVIDLGTAQALFGFPDCVNLAMLKLEDGATVREVIPSIQRDLPHLAASLSDLYVSSFKELELAERFSRYLALVGLVIAALSLSNTLSMNVSERTRELAILRAVGWRRWKVAALVLTDGLLLTAIGSIAGVVAASVFLNAVTASDWAGYLPRSLPIAVLGEGALMMLAAGSLGSLPSLCQALRMRPAQALHSA